VHFLSEGRPHAMDAEVAEDASQDAKPSAFFVERLRSVMVALGGGAISLRAAARISPQRHATTCGGQCYCGAKLRHLGGDPRHGADYSPSLLLLDASSAG